MKLYALGLGAVLALSTFFVGTASAQASSPVIAGISIYVGPGGVYVGPSYPGYNNYPRYNPYPYNNYPRYNPYPYYNYPRYTPYPYNNSPRYNPYPRYYPHR